MVDFMPFLKENLLCFGIFYPLDGRVPSVVNIPRANLVAIKANDLCFFPIQNLVISGDQVT